MRATSALPLLLALQLAACGGGTGAGDGGVDAPPVDGGMDARVDGGLDGAADAGTEAGTEDASDAGSDGAADAPDAASDAPADGWSPECCETLSCGVGMFCDPERCTCIRGGGCCSGDPCASGELCDMGTCTCKAGGGCCDGSGCGMGRLCNPVSCECVRSTSCCGTGECPSGFACDPSTCECAMDVPCDPPCGAGMSCELGVCVPDCLRTGCPDGQVCSRVRLGCVDRVCTDARCLFTLERCAPDLGCWDPCEPDSDWDACRSIGGQCRLGECIDPLCGGASGREPTPCDYVPDRCGIYHCVERGTAPPDPPSCDGPDEPMPRIELCACPIGGGCVDLRYPGP